MNKMKLTTRLLLLMTLFVVSAISFTACSSEDDLAADQERGVVKTEFTISFPQQIVGTTRMITKVVQGQADPVFRGISSIQLRPFSLLEKDISSSTTLTSPITLIGGTIYGKQGPSGTSDNVIASNALYGTSKSHLYKDVSIAIGTRSFLFYGLATDEETSEDVSGYAVNGRLNPNETTPTNTLDDISFSLQPISTVTSPTDEASTIASYLTSIANTSAIVGSETKKMTDYFPNFTTLTAGSWTSVKAVVQEIYTSIKNNTDNLSTAIKNAILVAATPDGDGVLTFDKGDYANLSYPADLGLPDGAAYIQWVGGTTNAFQAAKNDNSMNISELGLYTYPASLYYWGLSNIKTSTDSKSTFYAQTTGGAETSSWSTILGNYETDDGVVQSKTRSIAIKEPVEYAVGRLDVTVSTYNGETTLKDYGTYIGGTTFGSPDDPENPKDIAIGTNFPITGILISNQRAVDYKFETKETATSYTIYDSQIEDGCYLNAGSNTPKSTHTLVLETPFASTSNTAEENEIKSDLNANVNIAVEFQNNSTKTIVGKAGCLIYPGTKFYLVGTLMPGKNGHKTLGKTDDPKYVRGSKKGDYINQAFVQDYVTTANFKVKSFANAYNMLPDLRSPKLEIGMSVDLTWESGITQDITIE